MHMHLTRFLQMSIVICGAQMAFAATGPGEIGSAQPGAQAVDDGSHLVRCKGLNSKGVQIGVDFQLDPADRPETITTFEADSTGVIDLDTLGAPSHFLRVDSKDKLQVFGFKTFNDGIDEVMSITYVAGSPQLSTLKIGDGKSNVAVKNIDCAILK